MNDCPFTKEDYNKDPKRTQGYMTTQSLKKYIRECRGSGVKDCVSGFLIGYTPEMIKELMGDE